MPKQFLTLWRANRRARQLLRAEIRRLLLTDSVEGAKGASQLEARVERVKTLRDRISALSAESPARQVESAGVAGFGALLLIATTLLIVWRVPVTTIESELTLSEMSFSLAQDSPILEPVVVEDITLHDISSAVGPDGSALLGNLVQIRSSPVHPGPAIRGQITLPGLRFPAGASVSIRNAGANRFEIEWNQAEAIMAFDIAAKGPVEIALAPNKGNARTQIDRPSQYGIHVLPAGNTLSLTFSIARDSTVEFLPQIPVQEIDFGDSDSESVRRGASAIISGSLVRSELGTEKVTLGRAEQFRLSGASWTTAQGDRITSLLGRDRTASGLRIRRVLLSKEGLKAEIYGQVVSVSYGPDGVERNAMPSGLEWIAANHRIKLIWAAIVFASGILLGLARWLSRGS